MTSKTRTLALGMGVALLVSSVALAQTATRVRISGTGHNLTCDESTGVTMTVTQTGGSYRAQGAFDGVNLFGRFDVTGQSLGCEDDSPGALCLQLVGNAEFGGDGSGFPVGTRTTFVLTIVIHGNVVTGVYHIGLLPSFPYEQYGTLTAAVVR